MIGDDVAVVPPKAGNVIVKTDMLVEHTDMPSGMTYRQAARKAVAMCVSDFAAKGVRPDSFMVSIGLKKKVTQSQVEQLAKGLRDAESEWRLHLVGGDTNESKELVIDCAMVGFASRFVRRRGASPGELLVVTGTFGHQAAGLEILAGRSDAEPWFRAVATKSVLEPVPNLEVGLALAPFLTSAMDSSDGLARSIHTLAAESGAGFELDCLPVGKGVEEFANESSVDPLRLVLEGGEEYVIVGTVKKSDLAKAKSAARAAGGSLIVIGRVTSVKGRVTLVSRGKKMKIRNRGWTHLL